jgi:hypothetical protein
MNPTVKNHKENIIGFKAVKKDEKGYYTDGLGNAKKMYFELGKEYEVNGEPVLCKNGIHFFRHYCFALDYLQQGNVILKIESIGEVQEDTEKCVTNKIKILELDYKEDVDDKNNTGNGNTGNGNTGNRNTGNRNSGDKNSGHWNSGDRNSGDWNSGHCNSGDKNSGNGNSGDWNSGDWNSGDKNSGDRNSGDWNSGDWNTGNGNSGDWNSGHWNSGNGNTGNGNSGDKNSGHWNSGHCNSGDKNSGDFNSCNGYRNFFCTQTRYFLFDIECTEEEAMEARFLDTSWFDLTNGYKEAWRKCPEEVLDQIKKLKNFNADKFFEITGRK